MSKIESASFGGECCFKCAHVLGLGSKAGIELHRDRYGAVDDPLYKERMCLHNPDGLREGHGDASSVCDLFELDPKRYHDLQTQQYEHEIQLRHGPEPVCECDDEDEDTGNTEESNVPDRWGGYRTTMGKAQRAVDWFNGGRPKSCMMPITCMKDDKVLDTEMVGPVSQNGMFRNLRLVCHEFRDCWNVAGKKAVWLHWDYQIKNGGGSGSMMTDVTSVEITDDRLTIKGYDFGTEAERSDWREMTFTVGIVGKPDATYKKAPDWFYDDMARPFPLEGEWLTPITRMKQIIQTKLEGWE